MICFNFVLRYFNGLAIKTFVIKSIDRYYKAATTIQKHFRGYYVRKYCLDIRKMKEWLKEVLKKNDDWSKAMHDYKKNICAEFEKKNEERVKIKLTKMVNKHHPMLRTKTIKGVFSEKENSHNDSEFEKNLRSLYARLNKK